MDMERDETGISWALKEDKKKRSKTPDRISYEAEVDVIRQQIGDIEDIRFRLGLSARKMAQLLLVDPSAWTRWTKKITPPPPHIYRALQWYLILQEKNPAFTPQVFLASHWFSLNQKKEGEREDQVQIEEISHLKTELEKLKTEWVLERNQKKTTREIDFAHQNTPQNRTQERDLMTIKKITYFTLGTLVGFFLAKFFAA